MDISATPSGVYDTSTGALRKRHGEAQTEATYPGTTQLGSAIAGAGPPPGQSNRRASAAAATGAMSGGLTTPSVASDDAVTDSLHRYHCQEYQYLLKLRETMKTSMTDFGAGVHDLFALKDVFLRMADKLPGAPVNDLLLVTSKVFRRGSEVARLLGSFFRVVYSDDFVDEDFHFTEARVTRKALRDAETRLAAVVRERDALKKENEALREAADKHQSVLTGLDEKNDVLEVRNAALEDNMAVLFQQLAHDFIFFNEKQQSDVAEDLAVQDKLSSARSQFAQSVEGVHNRLKFFQTVLHEIQEEVGTFDPTGTIKAKLKALDVHAANISQRFSAVKDGLLLTSQELTQALVEKRRIVNFSLQHLRAYEVQSQKMRTARQQLHDLRQLLSDVENTFAATFATGTVVRVDREGSVTISQPTGDQKGTNKTVGEATGAHGARLQRYVASTTRNITDLVHSAVANAQVLTQVVTMEEEHAAVLKAVALAVPNARPGDAAAAGAPPPGGPVPSASGAPAPGAAAAAGNGGDGGVQHGMVANRAQPGGAMITRGQAAAQDAYMSGRDDYSTKLAFLKEVYEERVSELEGKVERLQRKLVAAKREAEEAASHGMTRGGGGASQYDNDADDKDEAVKAKEKWVKSKDTMLSDAQESAQQALTRLASMQTGAFSSGAAKSYASPFAANVVTSDEPGGAASPGGRNIPVTVAPHHRVPLQGTDSARGKHEHNVDTIRALNKLALEHEKDQRERTERQVKEAKEGASPGTLGRHGTVRAAPGGGYMGTPQRQKSMRAVPPTEFIATDKPRPPTA